MCVIGTDTTFSPKACQPHSSSPNDLHRGFRPQTHANAECPVWAALPIFSSTLDTTLLFESLACHLRRLRFRIVGSAPSACLFAVFTIEAWYQERSSQLPPATLDDVVANIDHAVKIGVIDHVGIGNDFYGVGCVPVELSSYDKFPRLTRALLEKVYSAQDIEKVYGGNLLRLMRAVEQRAHELKDDPPIESSIDRK